ncbi:protein FAM13A-like [Boleophthalmus pectinirostris]|uniref:protein FAM13A-like n=1 Tax=Boleophthalmus pectinirostris TaxID=150288 RepID=UPI00242E871E|nr:protein FAM13A-like [Boleophthalmus pectinirostris]
MVEHLRSHGLNQEGLFRVNGNARAVQSLKERLECAEDVDLVSESDVSTVASLLKLYLRELPQALISPTVQQALLQHYQDFGDGGSCSDIRELLLSLPDVHLSLLRYLCHFLTQVELKHKENRMNAHNLATVFGPSIFHVTAGFEAMKEQTVCNKIMVRLIQNYNNIFEAQPDPELCMDLYPSLIIVKEAQSIDVDTGQLWSSPLKTPQPAPRIKAGAITPVSNAESLDQLNADAPKPRPRKLKVRRSTRSDTATRAQVPSKPGPSAGESHARPLSRPAALTTSRSPETGVAELRSQRGIAPDVFSVDTSSSHSMDSTRSSQEDDADDDKERPISPFYRSHLLSPRHRSPDVVDYLERTIRSTVEQHLFGINPLRDQRSEDCDSNPGPRSPAGAPTARERRRNRRQHDADSPRHRDKSSRDTSARTHTNKENIQWSDRGRGGAEVVEETDQRSLLEQSSKKWRHSPTLVRLSDKHNAHAETYERSEATYMEIQNWNDTTLETASSSVIIVQLNI